jgi:hypothetical protein
VDCSRERGAAAASSSKQRGYKALGKKGSNTTPLVTVGIVNVLRVCVFVCLESVCVGAEVRLLEQSHQVVATVHRMPVHDMGVDAGDH